MTKQERRAYWKDQVAAYQASGQSVKEWCEVHQLQPHRLWYWLRQFAPAAPARSTVAPTWFSVEVGDRPDSHYFTILYSGSTSNINSVTNPNRWAISKRLFQRKISKNLLFSQQAISESF